MQQNKALLFDVGLLKRMSQQPNFKLECILLMLQGFFNIWENNADWLKISY